MEKAEALSVPYNLAMPNQHPYATLSPDTVLDAVESLGLYTDGRQLALNSYENRVYQVGLDEAEPVIAKFYRPGRWSDAAILEEHAFTQALAESEIPVVEPMRIKGHTLHRHGDFRFALYRRQGGRVPELSDPETLEWLGRFLGRIHAQGRVSDYCERPALDVESFGQASYDYLLSTQVIPSDLRAVWQGVAAQALEQVRANFDRAGAFVSLRLHGDCHLGNMLWTESGPHFVDFDDSRMGPAIQDLWMLLSGDRREQTIQLSDVLSGYEEFMAFNHRELHLIEALRTLRLLHYSAWIARRWSDPAFPLAFPWFTAPRYWEERILELREQIALMQEPPPGPV